ncbi:2',3'-cyclic-nucleotide 2'-phosphodiesterase [Erwinia pyrifoliae]|uniref:2', 3'-cyclic nucleotide 2'-phosphodiesterase n=1 Tax=Erwinia pyrifoliae TaxID=79967 RepID=A0ABY5X7A0_ERWPY|nr:2',3'-cyclic-nucleotide 2'-phosphodiesterase [Erwinia pyrifoliae]MCT2387580.1 2', 3'-cyclic nucleotide 2'-phosphodiesterase [Erwinia pyrifoliae]MCU8585836.1 2', 3'-cyclic nucleotide 2'-phosphodiesterase [Erwinia pyrifoliae]UWS28862.1 2', 3'-cyclic nucleotide 2'-phosphodiesterase [Erwinia pyrifoliae]UWS33005.1 2', 3'-cyclic nucleotide 2'-phosphodiesterase [Erwinia pyrifoliae]UXK11852.1 2', 3'-cyclic nucleotide 2'-phosphodiesterase [Erwinia pyrifoliae]
MFKSCLTLGALLVSHTLHAATVDFRILETTDWHCNMMDFDTKKDRSTNDYRLVRTTLPIKGRTGRQSASC